MKLKLYFVAALALFLTTLSKAQYRVEKEIIEPAMVTLSQLLPDQVGGRYITSIAENGRYLRVQYRHN
jgi:hypothetical protein